MEFQPDKVETFLKIFLTSKKKILEMEGCLELELLKCLNPTEVLFTRSKWESELHLQKYRESQLFKETWAKTKPLFRNRAEAWTLENYE